MSVRDKKRYIVFQIDGGEYGFSEAKSLLLAGLNQNLGKIGMERANFRFIDNTYTQNKGIFRVSNESMNDVKLALSKSKVRIIGISGILKKARYKFLPKPQLEVKK